MVDEWLPRITATGSIGALVIAVLTLWREQSDRRREQARHVSAWLGLSNAGKERAVYWRQVHARNASKELVEDVQAIALLADGAMSAPQSWGWIPPEEEVDGTLRGRSELISIYELRFTDSAGRRWIRRQGRLRADRRWARD